MTLSLRKKHCLGKSKTTTEDGLPTVSVYRSASDIPPSWDALLPAKKRLLQSDYLRALEAAPPAGMKFAYLLFHDKENVVIGLAYCQIQRFSAEKSIRYDEKGQTPGLLESVGRYLQRLVASKFEFNTLVCGNLLFTGEHGFYFKANTLKEEEQIRVVNCALENLQEQLQKDSLPVSVVLYKEFYDQSRTSFAGLKQDSYKEFTIQPNMILDIRDHWESFEDYMGDLLSKYRVRTKRARKKFQAIERKELSAEDIAEHLPHLYGLYQSVVGNSGFNVINLSEQYLLSLKKHLPQEFSVHAYLDEGKIVAFYTILMTGQEMEAHFLGFERSYNRSHQIYLNILYDLVQHGIQRGAERVIFARTALEIKSSVGAIAHEMYCYMRHRNAISNNLLQPLLDYLRPDTDWHPRHPFK
ncbi:MAG: GNAT family N-acetyltransferase [Bacteroidota bacterium]